MLGRTAAVLLFLPRVLFWSPSWKVAGLWAVACGEWLLRLGGALVWCAALEMCCAVLRCEVRRQGPFHGSVWASLMCYSQSRSPGRGVSPYHALPKPNLVCCPMPALLPSRNPHPSACLPPSLSVCATCPLHPHPLHVHLRLRLMQGLGAPRCGLLIMRIRRVARAIWSQPTSMS